MREDAGALIVAISGGDREALRRLYDLVSPRLYGVALRILRNGDEAATALRETFLDLWHDPDAYRGEADPVGRLVAAVRGHALDRVRADAVEGHALDPFESQGDVEDPLAGAERSRAFKQLLGCLGQLTEERRRMILYAYYDGWSREALSIYFDAPVHAVNTWVWRSIAELDACLGT